jgi:hypothetical protein
MSAEEAQDVGESGGMSERTAKIVLALVAIGAVWGIVAVWPEIAYVIVGIIGTCGWQKTRGWIGRRRGDEAEAAEDEEAVETLAESMHELADPHVFLADLADRRGLSKDVTRALLEAVGIRVRRAVRNGTRTGVGVHRDDLPPLPRDEQKAPVGGVDLQQQHNQQGVRVQRTNGGMIIYDLADEHRHHRIQ